MTQKIRFSLLPRKRNTDKRDYGHTLIVAGSPSYRGAAILASSAALASGSGLVTLACARSLADFFSRGALAETMLLGLPSKRRGLLSAAAAKRLLEFIARRKISSLVLGPGLSTDPEAALAVRRLVRSVRLSVILDADGLNAFRSEAFKLKKRSGPIVLTPHEGEFERLFGEACPKTMSLRCALAKKVSKIYDCVLVLKGFRTVVASPRLVYVNTTGNPGMAKGGSGDVLAGMIGAFVSQGLDVFQAACWAVYYHGKAGDMACKKKGELSVLASDIIHFLPAAFKTKKVSLLLE